MKTTNENYYKAALHSIDAWRTDRMWEWNDSYLLESGIYFAESSITTRTILSFLRRKDYLSEASKGTLKVVDEWPLIEIQIKNTGQPILCLMFDETPIKE